MINRILRYALILAIISVIGLSIALHKTTQEKARYKANQSALLSKVEYYQTESGKNAASVQKLTLSYDELKENYTDVCKTAKDLNIKLKRMQSASNTTTVTDVKVITVVKDTVVFRNGVLDSLLIFKWRDSWMDIVGRIDKDSVDLDVHSTDTILQIVHRVPHKWWFIKWGTKAIRQEVMSSNPHTKITYTDYIELK